MPVETKRQKKWKVWRIYPPTHCLMNYDDEPNNKDNYIILVKEILATATLFVIASVT